MEGEKREICIYALDLARAENIEWMEVVVQKYKISGTLVPEAYAGTVFVDRACFALPKRRKFKACKVDLSCVTECWKVSGEERGALTCRAKKQKRCVY